jgi:hypothetical protein
MRRLLSALALTLAAASTASAAGSPPAVLVIKVKSVSVGVTANDRPPKGLSKGDRLLERSRLLNVARQFGKPAGAVVGRDEALITLTSARAGTVEGVARFPGGTIRFRGVEQFAATAPISVTGGTGRYAHARGTLTIGKGDTPLNTYRLSLPAQPDEHGATLRG